MSINNSIVEIVAMTQYREITEIHTDHLGVDHKIVYSSSSPFNIENELALHASQVELKLANDEAHALIAQMDTIDFSSITFEHTTKQNAIKYLLRWGMRQSDTEEAIKILPLITWLKANYTGQILADFLGITLAQLQAVDDRYTALQTIEATLEVDPTLAQDIP